MDVDALAPHIREILSREKRSKISFGSLKLEARFTNSHRVKYNNNKVCRVDEIKPVLHAWSVVKETTKRESVNGWSRVMNSDCLREYKTQHSELTASISEYGGKFKVQLPDIEDKDDEFDLFKCAELYLYIFLFEQTAFEAEYTHRKQTVVKDQVSEITGIGDNISTQIAVTGVEEWSDVKEKLHKVSNEYRGDAREEIEEKINSDEGLLDGSGLDELSAKAVVKNI